MHQDPVQPSTGLKEVAHTMKKTTAQLQSDAL